MAGFGKSGVPDRVGCHRGLFFGVEVKADTDVTALQQRNLDDIVASGGKAFLVRINDHVTEGYDELEQWLKEVESKYEAYRQITAPAVRATPDTDSKDTASVHAGLRWRTAT